jgi:hypothetical protein
LRCRAPLWCAEAVGLTTDGIGAAASSALKSLAVVSAVLADTGTLSLAKCVGVSFPGLKFFEPESGRSRASVGALARAIAPVRPAIIINRYSIECPPTFRSIPEAGE